MERLEIILGMAVVYLIVTTMVGSLSARKSNKDVKSFMTAKNQLGPMLVGLLLMSEFIGTGSTIGTAQTAYEIGYSASWNLITLGAGFLLYAFLMAPKYNALGEYTISGALAKHYGNSVRAAVSLIMVYALTTVNVSMFTGGAATVAKLLDIEISLAVLIIGAATVISVAFGGLKGVGLANLIHVTFKYLGLFVVAWAAWAFFKEHPEVAAQIPAAKYDMMALGVGKLGAWTLANIGAIFSTQYVLQSISSLKTPKDAKTTAIIAGLAIVPIGFLAGFIGVSSSVIFPDIPSIMALPAFFDIMNPWAAAIAVSGIISATLVTILACTIGASALVMKDMIMPFVNLKEENNLKFTRIMTVIVGLAPIPFAMFVPGLLNTVFFARSLRTSVAVLAIFMFYAPRLGSPKSAIVALLASLVATSAWFFSGNPGGIDAGYIAAGTPALIIIMESLLFRNAKVPVPSEN